MSSILSKLINLAGNITGTLPVANGGTGVTTSTGTTNVVLSNGPTLVAPVLGTPASGTLSNCTGYPAATSSTAGTVSIEAPWSSEASLPTVTWSNSGGSNPSTVSSSAYKWYQVGKLVTLTWRVIYTNAGSNLTNAFYSIPGGLPTPVQWSAGGSTGYSYMGQSMVCAGFVNAQNVLGCTYLTYNDDVATTWTVHWVTTTATGSGQKAWLGTISYQTA